MNPVDRSSLKNWWIAFDRGFDGRSTNSPRRMTAPAFATPPSRISSTGQVCQGLLPAACALLPAACCLHPAAYTLPPDEWGTVGPLHALDAWNHKRHIPLASEQPAIARSLPLPLPPPVAQLVPLIVAGRTIVPVGVVIGERMKERAPEL